MTSLRDYHRLGRAADPKDAVLSASQLIRGFNPNPRSGAHPAATLAAITGEPSAPTFDMMAGAFLHLLLLDGLEPERVGAKLAVDLGLKVGLHDRPWTWTATGLGAKGTRNEVVSLDGMVRLGDYLLPPPTLKGKGTLIGDEQRRVLQLVAGELGLELAGGGDTDRTTAALRAFDEALATAGWLSGGLKGPWPSNYFSEHLPPSAANAYHLLCEAPGQVEQDFFGQWGDIRTRARPDKIAEGTLINLKRTWKAHPNNFWWEYELRGWGIAEAFYEAAMGGDAMCEDCDGAGEVEFTTMGSDNMDIDGWIEPCGNPECVGGRVPGIALRPWTFGAIAPATKTAPPQAFVYPVSEERQEEARRQLDDMMLRYQECLETGNWWGEEEMHAEQPCPPPGVNRAWHEETEEQLAEQMLCSQCEKSTETDNTEEKDDETL